MKSSNNSSGTQINIRNRMWQVVYPLLVYYVLYNVVAYVAGSYLEEQFGHLICLLIAGIVTLIPIVMIYNQAPVVKIPLDFKNKKTVLCDLLAVALVVACAIGLNLIIGMTGLAESSEAYSKVSRHLLDGSIWVKILSNAIVIPVLEEYLFRGLICGQLQVWSGMWPAVIISAITFGMMHLNIVQFVYAFLCGIALGILYCRTNKLLLCILAHGMANFIVVIATNMT